MKRFRVEVRGISPLLMHSNRGIDPTDPLMRKLKAVTDRRKKSDDDRAQMDRLEFELNLYANAQGPYVPDSHILGALRRGASVSRRGRDVGAGVDVVETEIPLEYEGPRTIEELYQQRYVDRRPARINSARVFRVRPIFRDWRLRFTLLVDLAIIGEADVREALDIAGARQAIGDYRPRFGRFEVTKFQEVAA